MKKGELSTAELHDLSDKQRQVLDLVLDRRTNKEIALLLGISASAVEQRLQSVRRRLGVVSRADLARTYQDLLDTCQKSTGEKLQVVEKSMPVQTYGINSADEELVHRPEPAAMSGGVQDSKRISGEAPYPMLASSRESRFLMWLDRIAGMPGRIAAITVTATSLAFLLAIVSRLADLGR
ncbi:MAG: helix-turn-helix domain-containing protein [Novosphingobium sp.]